MAREWKCCKMTIEKAAIKGILPDLKETRKE